MKALVFERAFQVAYEKLPDPTIENPRDVVLEVAQTALCGSDLHPYRGLEKGLDPGTVMGHELVGTVVEAGTEVTRFKAGDLVYAPFTTNCGSCYYCQTGLTCRCRHGQLLGWREQGDGLHGAQAEYVRVPMADSTLVKVPEGLSTATALLLGDNLATGYYAALQSEVGPRKSCVVVGCGAVGLMAVLAAVELGSERVFAVDPLPGRRERAQEFGAITLAPEQARVQILEATDGHGADCVIEAVGNLAAQRTAYEIVRPGGVLSTVGVHTEPKFAFTPAELYDRNLTFKVGRCPARGLAEAVLPLARRHSHQLETLFTHRRKLSEGPEAYRQFESREPGCLKIILTPDS